MFCGAKPLTREHVVSGWVSEVLNSHPRHRGAPEPFVWRDKSGRIKGAHRRKIDIAVKVVCGPCNHGWMSQIEERAIPVLKEMILGNVTRLGASERQSIAAWAALKAILLRYTAPGANAPEKAWLRELYLHQLPPETCFIWVAAYRGDVEFHYDSRQLLIQRDPRKEPRPEWNFGNAINVTVLIGHLLINVLWVREGKVPKPDAAGLIRIWPDPDGDAVWPPPGVYEDDGLERMSERFEAATRHMRL